jgi:hypothetical protein
VIALTKEANELNKQFNLPKQYVITVVWEVTVCSMVKRTDVSGKCLAFIMRVE